MIREPNWIQHASQNVINFLREMGWYIHSWCLFEATLGSVFVTHSSHNFKEDPEYGSVTSSHSCICSRIDTTDVCSLLIHSALQPFDVFCDTHQLLYLLLVVGMIACILFSWVWVCMWVCGCQVHVCVSNINSYTLCPKMFISHTHKSSIVFRFYCHSKHNCFSYS